MLNGTRRNFGTGVPVSILKPTPIIYPAFFFFKKKPQPIHILDFTESIVFFKLIYPFVSSAIGGWGQLG